MTHRLSALPLLLCVAAALAQVPYDTTPNWRSSDRRYATGGAIVDINRDGWPDIVVANGNDMRTEPNCMYINNGSGGFPTAPNWLSGDSAKHGHLAIGDYDGDGWPDVAITVLNPLTNAPGIKVYRNNNGVLSSTPVWTAATGVYMWHCEWGDVDGDGDLDLLVGSSDAYGGRRWQNYIFFNNNGVLSSNPGWISADNQHLDHMQFCDIDDDGDLDVVAIGSRTCNWVYRNNNGVVNTVPDWNSTDNFNQFANTLALGDVTGDGRRDLIMSDNNQLSGGSGYIKQYNGNAAGSFSQSWNWRFFDGYVSAVALADLNNDGKLDLAIGKWWGPARIFLNNGSGFNAAPSWSSAVSPVVEVIAFGDVNRDGLRTAREHKNIRTGRTLSRPLQLVEEGIRLSDTSRKLYYLDRQPIERIDAVYVDGLPLATNQYCYNAMNGWISLKTAPRATIWIDYTYSTKLDMLVTDWENNGNILFIWR